MQKKPNIAWDSQNSIQPPEYNGRGRPARGGSSFLARFGQVIVRHGVAAIPSSLFHFQSQLQLTAQEVWFVAAILAHKWTEELPHPNLSRMAAQTGVQERRLRRYKQSLSSLGYLLVYPRYETNGRQDSNYYDFAPLFERLENLIAADRADRQQVNSISADPTDEPDNEESITPNPPPSGDPDTSFVARFGSVIVSRGVAAIPQALFTCQGDLSLTPQQVWFVGYILSVPWSPPYPYPSLLKMAARTGYSKMQLHEIKNSLVDAGYLQLIRRTKQDGGQDSNGYDFAGLFETIRDKLQPHSAPTSTAPASSPDAPTQIERNRQGRAGANKRAQNGNNIKADTGLTGEVVTRLTPQAVNRRTRVADNRLTSQEDTKFTGESDSRLTSPVRQTSTTGRANGLPGRRMPGTPYIEPSIKEAEKDDSNHLSSLKKARTTNEKTESRPPYSPYVAQVITDFSQELGDADHIISNVSQSLRLWESSGLDEQEFVASLYNAKTLTRKYQSRPHTAAMQNKMAYFFTVLRSLLGVRG